MGFVNLAEAQELVEEIVHNLHPTQSVIGLSEVEVKAEEIAEMSREERMKYLAERPVPVVIGPNKQYYMLDRHHLSRSLVDSGHKRLFIQIVANWSRMSLKNFWARMDKENLAYLRNADGKLIDPHNIPDHISDLKDDPYRSLAYFARKEGAYGKPKSAAPFAEFAWANYYRNLISKEELKDWDEAVKKTVYLSRQKEAANLPGYSGRFKGCVKLF